MKQGYKAPEIEIIRLETEQCILSGSNTPGFGPGNATPVAEFNVYMDAEAYGILLNTGLPITIAGFDLCQGEIALKPDDLAHLAQGAAPARFLERATSQLLQFKQNVCGESMVDLPDAIAVAAALWPDFTAKAASCHAHCCTEPGHTHGQVIFYRSDRVYESTPQLPPCNVQVIEAVHHSIFKERFLNLLIHANV